MLVIALVIVCWIVLPLPFAIAVGRAFRAGSEPPAPPTTEATKPDDSVGGIAA